MNERFQLGLQTSLYPLTKSEYDALGFPVTYHSISGWVIEPEKNKIFAQNDAKRFRKRLRSYFKTFGFNHLNKVNHTVILDDEQWMKTLSKNSFPNQPDTQKTIKLLVDEIRSAKISMPNAEIGHHSLWTSFQYRDHDINGNTRAFNGTIAPSQLSDCLIVQCYPFININGARVLMQHCLRLTETYAPWLKVYACLGWDGRPSGINTGLGTEQQQRKIIEGVRGVEYNGRKCEHALLWMANPNWLWNKAQITIDEMRDYISMTHDIWDSTF